MAKPFIFGYHRRQFRLSRLMSRIASPRWRKARAKARASVSRGIFVERKAPAGEAYFGTRVRRQRSDRRKDPRPCHQSKEPMKWRD